MDIITDIRFLMFAWTIGTCLLQHYVGIKFMSTDIKQIKVEIAELEKKYEIDKKERTDLLIQVSKDVAYIKGQLESDNKIIKLLEKVIKV